MPDESPSLDRREFLLTGGAIAGAAALGGSALLGACGTGDRAPNDAKKGGPTALSPDEAALLEEVADTILPTTPASPGAKAAGAGAIAALLLADCYDTAALEKVRATLATIAARSEARVGGAYTRLSPMERERLLSELDAEARREGAAHGFHLVRELAQRAYFSSETGMTKALRYVRVPGRWDGCTALEPGQPAWG